MKGGAAGLTTQILMEALPIKKDADGELRVGETLLTLDTVVSAFSERAIVAEIAQQYPSIQLADVYSVIGYYLHQKKKVEAYLKRREKLAEEVRKQNEAQFAQSGIRERLLARKKNG